MAAFRQGLREAGFVEDQHSAIEYRWADNQLERLPALVADLLRRPVAVIVTNTPGALAAKAATTTVPIVFATGGDPVRDGLVANLNRPGGNLTGISFISVELAAKQLGLLRELRPGVPRVAVLNDPAFHMTDRFVSEVRAAASAIGQQIEVLYISTDREIETAFTTLVQHGAGALLGGGSGGFVYSRRERIVALAAQHRIPAIYISRDYVAAGGLMSYAASMTDAYRQAGIYAGRILKGDKPGDLPVLQPTKLELVINMKTAKALGLEVPDRLLAIIRRGYRVKRRHFITLVGGATAGWPLTARAQQLPDKIHRIGFLANDPAIPTQPAGQAFLDGLRQSGFIEGKNINIERRFAEGRLDRYAELVAELIRLEVDVLVTSANEATQAAKRASS